MSPNDINSYAEIAARVAAAAFVGMLIGLDRELLGKHAGMRTLALVSLGSALIILCGIGGLSHAPEGSAAEAVSRALQGIFAGIGFLGAGVIVRDVQKGEVSGLTTAASIWVSAGLGAACGFGLWKLVTVAAVAALLVLSVGQYVEDFLVWCVKKIRRE